MEDKLDVLIIDDDVGICETLADIFTIVNFHVIIAHNGNTAIDIIKQKHVDVALIDMRMPGLSGVETLEQIKKIRPKIKAYIMTAYANDSLLQEAKTLGVIDILFKPLNITSLI
ncbi:MAG TPA: response regulator [Candidatus Lokiarchaeia archaeon]|nr:response regulator [Candidatus Lokiarchaeia archaeon]